MIIRSDIVDQACDAVGLEGTRHLPHMLYSGHTALAKAVLDKAAKMKIVVRAGRAGGMARAASVMGGVVSPPSCRDM